MDRCNLQAAHQLPPTGGFGMNTGLQDVFNLCWKLAGVCQGWAGEGLLATYEHERWGIARGNADWSLRNIQLVRTSDSILSTRDISPTWRPGRFCTGAHRGCVSEASACCARAILWQVGSIRRAATTGDPTQVQAAIDESYHYGNFIGQDLGVVYPVEVGAAVCPDGTPFPVS